MRAASRGSPREGLPRTETGNQDDRQHIGKRTEEFQLPETITQVNNVTWKEEEEGSRGGGERREEEEKRRRRRKWGGGGREEEEEEEGKEGGGEEEALGHHEMAGERRISAPVAQASFGHLLTFCLGSLPPPLQEK